MTRIKDFRCDLVTSQNRSCVSTISIAILKTTVGCLSRLKIVFMLPQQLGDLQQICWIFPHTKSWRLPRKLVNMAEHGSGPMLQKRPVNVSENVQIWIRKVTFIDCSSQMNPRKPHLRWQTSMWGRDLRPSPVLVLSRFFTVPCTG